MSPGDRSLIGVLQTGLSDRIGHTLMSYRNDTKEGILQIGHSRMCPANRTLKEVSYRRTLMVVSYNQGAVQIGYPRRCPADRALKKVSYK